MKWIIFMVLWFMASLFVFYVYYKEHVEQTEKMPVIVSFLCLIFGPILLLIGGIWGIVDSIKKALNKRK